jgi:hypothetical protein
MSKYFFFYILRILLGLTFIASGYLKLYPIEPFELNFIDLGVANWFTAPFIARILIALEFFLGLLLIFNLSLKKFTLKFVIGLLIFFTFYLIIQIAREGNQGNCGCFGTVLQMTPLESIIKNLFLIGIAVFLFRFHPDKNLRFGKILIPLAAMTSVTLPFLLNPIDLVAAEYRQPQAENFRMDLAPLYADTIKFKPSVDLSTGKHIVAFFSMTCSHCKATAFKIHVLEKRNPSIPFFMVLNGKDEWLKSFLEETKSDNIPFMILHGNAFSKITGGSVPVVYWMNNGIVERKSLYISLEENEILKWLKD